MDILFAQGSTVPWSSFPHPRTNPEEAERHENRTVEGNCSAMKEQERLAEFVRLSEKLSNERLCARQVVFRLKQLLAD